VVDQPIPDGTAVQIEILQIGLAAGELRLRQPPPQTHPGQFELEIAGMMQERLAAELPNPLLPPLRRSRQAKNGALTTTQGKGYLETAHGDALEHGFQMPLLGALTAQETAPGRRIEEEIPHLDGGTLRVGMG